MSNNKFEENLKKLNIIVKELENQDLDIDKALEFFKNGKELIKQLNNELVDIEQKVVKVIKQEENN